MLATLLFLTLEAAPLPTAPRVDLPRYMGTWHEIARLPNRFQKDCACTTATYDLRPDGQVTVLNRCLTPEGKRRTAKGRAKVVDPATGAKLKVTFFWPFYGDYWILHLDPDYRHVLVGTPNRRYLWILAREARMEPGTYQDLVRRARDMGFPTSGLIQTPSCLPGQP